MKKAQAIFMLIVPILPFSWLLFNIVENLSWFITTVAMSLVAMILYFIHLFQNQDIKKNIKLIYCIALLFANMITTYIYWFQYVKKDLSND